MNIRPLAAQDRDAILQILEQRHIFYPREIQVALELLDETLNLPEEKDYRIFCALTDDGQVGGYICFGPVPLTEHTYDLYWIAVDKACARNGMATRLLEYMEAEVVRNGGKYIYIDTSSSPGYEAARRFYQKNGFRVACVLEHFYRPDDHKVLFVKEV